MQHVFYRLRGNVTVIVAFIMVSLSFGQAHAVDQLVGLAKGGKPRCIVVTTEDTSSEVKVAIDDLVRCFRVMSGAQLQVVYDQKDVPANLTPIRIGLDGDDPFLKTAGTSQAFVLRVLSDKVIISGLSPSSPGTMFGVYDFLEELGVRWFMPGELGEVIPKKKTVAIPLMNKLEKPDFAGRTIQYSGHYPSGGQTEIWERRVKLRPSTGIPGSHAFKKYIHPDKYFKKHPEYFSLLDGKRQPIQLCTSNPQVVRLFSDNMIADLRKRRRDILPIGPNDGGTFCECGPCTALDTGDFDPYYNTISKTDRLMVFFNQVAKNVTAEFPSTKFSFYLYVTHRRLPLKVKPHPNIIGMIAPIKLCIIHGPDNVQCPQRSEDWVRLAKGWSSLLSEVWSRDYGSLLYGGAYYPLSLTHRWRVEIPMAKKLGFRGFRVETWISWSGQMIDPYLMAKLWWDANTDVDALIDDYFEKFFGPAAAPMKRYWQRIDEATAKTTYHGIGLSSLNIPHWYTREMVDAGKRDIAEAQKLSKTRRQRRRIQFFKLSHVALDNLLIMNQKLEAGQFKQASKAYQNIYDIHEAGTKLTKGDPPFVDAYAFVHLYQDWDQSCGHWNKGADHYSRLAAQRVTKGNALVAMLPKMWLTRTDTQMLGKKEHWYDPEVFLSADWVETDTHTSAKNQGLDAMKTTLWYRCTVTVPRRFQGREIKVYFAGIRGAIVWVNGQEMGKVPHAQPREIDVTKGIRFDQDNLIVVRTRDGEGHGIFRPAFLWSPRSD